MKQLIILLILSLLFATFAHSQTNQQKHNSQPTITVSFAKGLDEFFTGYHALQGISEKVDSTAAVAFFRISASKGYGQAMKFLGSLQLYGRAGMEQNTDSAYYWLNAALAANCYTAYFDLGHIYQEGIYAQQDFKKAAEYYRKGADYGVPLCKDFLGYLYYKGLGVQQSYDSAVALYRPLAVKGTPHAQYFMGLLQRNGYGLPANQDSAKYWLKKSAAQNYKPAIHELLAEPLPENRTLVNAELIPQLKKLQKYTENFKAADTNDISGHYSGYAVYQDFSRTGINRIVQLTVDLQKKGEDYVGSWTEFGPKEKNTTKVKARFQDNTLIFDSSTQYIRRDQYSYGSPDRYRFEKAKLSIQYFNDSIHFTGDMQFYSLRRREPGQPIFIALGRPNENNNDYTQITKTGLKSNTPTLLLYPNPAKSYINASFTIKKNEKIKLSIMDMTGRTLQTKNSSSLPAGSYTYTFNLQNIVPGAYLLQIITSSGKTAQHFIKN